MDWFNEPKNWTHNDRVLTATAAGDTDFWHTTGYGYVRKDGHLGGEFVVGDAVVSTQVKGDYRDQYDQAGVMAWVDDEHWLKAGVELFDGKLRLSTVVTVGYSNWAFSTLPRGVSAIWLRLLRKREAIEVYSSLDGVDYELSSLSYLPPDRPALVGAMFAAPVGSGFEVEFNNLTIEHA